MIELVNTEELDKNNLVEINCEHKYDLKDGKKVYSHKELMKFLEESIEGVLSDILYVLSEKSFKKLSFPKVHQIITPGKTIYKGHWDDDKNEWIDSNVKEGYQEPSFGVHVSIFAEIEDKK